MSHQGHAGSPLLAANPVKVSKTWTTILYEPEDTEIIADVIFVHGLLGHPKRTWEHEVPKSSKGISYYWPLEALPQDFPNVRVMTYGYESAPTGNYSSATTHMNINQHARTLLAGVAASRDDCLGRPIIFMAHSLGGILVKDTIQEAFQCESAHQKQKKDVGESCSAIFFFGTPHQGADIAAWGDLVRGVIRVLPGGPSTYNGLLKDLEPDSRLLAVIARNFNARLLRDNKIRVCSIQEGRGMTRTNIGNTKVRGQPVATQCAYHVQVVPDTSSWLNLGPLEENFFIQDKDHLEMCKFSSRTDGSYQTLRSTLKGYLADIEKRRLSAISPGDTLDSQVSGL